MAKRKDQQARREMWDQQPGESAAQYAKFCRYRDMKYVGMDGAKLDGIQTPFGKRSIRGLATQLGLARHQELGVLSTRFSWAERCEAYDVEIENQAREQTERAILKMRKDHADLAAQMVKKAAKRLLTIPEEEISAADIVRLVDVGVKIERLSRGESTENKQISGEATLNHMGAVTVKTTNDLNLTDLSDEELEQLEGLLEKLHPEPVL